MGASLLMLMLAPSLPRGKLLFLLFNWVATADLKFYSGRWPAPRRGLMLLLTLHLAMFFPLLVAFYSE